MNTLQVRKLVGSRIFTATFRKVSGNKEIRTMNGTLNIASKIKGVGKPITDGRVVLTEFKSKGLRSFYPETLISIRVGGHLYDGEGKEVTAA